MKTLKKSFHSFDDKYEIKCWSLLKKKCGTALLPMSSRCRLVVVNVCQMLVLLFSTTSSLGSRYVPTLTLVRFVFVNYSILNITLSLYSSSAVFWQKLKAIYFHSKSFENFWSACQSQKDFDESFPKKLKCWSMLKWLSYYGLESALAVNQNERMYRFAKGQRALTTNVFLWQLALSLVRNGSPRYHKAQLLNAKRFILIVEMYGHLPL